MATPATPLAVTGDHVADELIRQNALALLIAMLLDQQISIELAFRGPLRLQQRLGELSVPAVLARSEDDLVALFSEKPALHRFPASMARRCRALCEHLDEHHNGDAASLWSDDPTAATMHARISELPGFGAEKTMILIAVLAKRFGLRPRGWKARAGAFADNEPRSVADIDSPEAHARVREWKTRQRAAGRSKQDPST